MRLPSLRLLALLALVACEIDAPPGSTGAGSTASTAASAVPATPAPVAPAFHVARGVCPFECCHYGPWVAEGPVDVHAAERASGRVAFRLAAGDSVVADSGNVHIMVPGMVMVTQPVELGFPAGVLDGPATPGEVVLVLEYHGEGHYNVRFRGHDAVIESFWTDSEKTRMMREPVQEWWARVRAKDGRQGWVRMNDAPIGGVDLCG